MTSSPKKRSDDADTGTIIMTTKTIGIITALSVGGLMTKRGVFGSAEGTMRKTDTIGEATRIPVDTRNPLHIPDPLRLPAAEDHPLRITDEEAGLPLLTTAAGLDHRLASKRMATTSITARAFPLIAIHVVVIPPPPKHHRKRKSETRLRTSLLD